MHVPSGRTEPTSGTEDRDSSDAEHNLFNWAVHYQPRRTHAQKGGEEEDENRRLVYYMIYLNNTALSMYGFL